MQSDKELEQLLRKAPSPVAPFGLERRLVQQAGTPARKEAPGWGWFSAFQKRSWAPALALGSVVAGLITTLAFQQSTLKSLRQEKELSTGILAAEARARTGAQEQTALDHEFEVLQKQLLELRGLRAEMAAIEELLAQQPTLAAENKALRAELARLAPDSAITPEMQATLTEARRKAERIQCVNNLKQIGLAARIFASQNESPLPADFASMKLELSTPKILICPSDPARAGQELPNWEQFARVGSSYNMLSPGVPETIPSAVYARCPFHNNALLSDGSVHQFPAEQRFIQRDGYWEVER